MGLCLVAVAEDPSQPVVKQSPPSVQVLVPGFVVRELPVTLTNINNVKYRDDGALVALAYDGKIWLLRDSDGDGLEDQPQLFWDNPIGLRAPIGMDVTPPGYEHGVGVAVVGKTQCLLIVDSDGDDRADQEIEVAGGWNESFHPVDGLGVAFDPRDGSVYYGRGTYNFTDPLLRDKEGVSQYKLDDESAAILHVSPDFKSRRIVATGIRFPVAIRLNRHGDLFATDQEGATWVPNGNPFDELLHIQKGRHYGFPARHPQHLPNVIDEPSTFDYAPQHQSVCGLNFNEPLRDGGPTFGPNAWASDAIVSGFSRGKLYRTQLARTDAGYVARTQLLACLNMLTVDACIGPQGELVVACHSGGPDWGSGPTGEGKLFKIEYVGRDLPQPVFASPAGPRELRVEFDRPVDATRFRDVLEHASLEAGEFVRAGDRFETLRPGYAVVKAQVKAPRHAVPLHSAQLTPDGRTLVLASDSMASAVHYALTLPRAASTEHSANDNSQLPQQAAIDLDFDLTGCQATWQPADGGPAWTGWLPHFNLDVSRAFTAGSATHDSLWQAMQSPGELILRCQLNLTDMLRPAVQPGSTIDYEYPPEEVTISFQAPENATVQLVELTPHTFSSQSPAKFLLTVAADAPKIVPIAIRIITKSGNPKLVATWTTNEDARPRPFPLRRLLMPWADLEKRGTVAVDPYHHAELEGGSWGRGYREFFGETASCSKCHTVNGRGGTIGPDLSNLVHRDYASVLRDITQPSFAMNPDYLSYTAVLHDGRVLTGVVHSKGETVTIGHENGTTTTLAKSEIESLHPSSVSTMPDNLATQLGPDRLRDLLTFLLTPPPSMPRDHPKPRPKARTIAEVESIVAGAPQPPEQTRPINVVLVAGPKDHGPGEHDYPAWQNAWAELLSAANDVEVSNAWEWPSTDQWHSADTIVFYQRGDWNSDRAKDVDAYLERGGGLVYIHYAVDGREHGRDFAERIGLAAAGPAAFRHGDMTLRFDRASSHPIIRNFIRLELVDETYWKLSGELPNELVLATSLEDSEPQPQLWITEPRNGRVFVAIPGHYSWTFDDPLFRVLLLRGIAWSAREPVDRFNELVWPGADIAR